MGNGEHGKLDKESHNTESEDTRSRVRFQAAAAAPLIFAGGENKSARACGTPRTTDNPSSSKYNSVYVFFIAFIIF